MSHAMLVIRRYSCCVSRQLLPRESVSYLTIESAWANSTLEPLPTCSNIKKLLADII